MGDDKVTLEVSAGAGGAPTEPRTGEKTGGAGDRAGVIEAVKTPLGLFVVLILAAEAVFVAVATTASQAETRHIVIFAMLGMFVAFLSIVSGLAWWRPEALRGLSQRIPPLPVTDSRLADEEAAYNRLIDEIGDAHRVFSTTIASDSLHRPVHKKRDRYLALKTRRLRKGELDMWRELFISEEAPREKAHERITQGGDRYWARWIEAGPGHNMLPTTSFTLIDKRDGSTAVVAGWQKLIFAGRENRDGTFVHSSDRGICELFREQFDMLWHAAQPLD